jgi:ADP-ribose pyrophosphatase YjhB (NUDIX family)
MRYEVVDISGGCRLPSLSVGIIATTHIKGVLHFLLIRRKDGMAFCDIVRRRNPITNKLHLQNLVNTMTNSEKQRILSEKHETMWKQMWSGNCKNAKTEQATAHANFQKLLESGDLQEAVRKSETDWKETEWEFPKGRKNYQERDQACAVREFEEETGIPSEQMQIISNIVPIEEAFTGTNGKAYRHRHYVAYINNPNVCLDNFQKSEVSAISWFPFNVAMNKIRDYHYEKKRSLSFVNSVVKVEQILSAEDNRDVRQRRPKIETWSRSQWGSLASRNSPPDGKS